MVREEECRAKVTDEMAAKMDVGIRINPVLAARHGAQSEAKKP